MLTEVQMHIGSVLIVIWLVIGLVVYFGYSTRHSKVQRQLASEHTPAD